MNHINLNIVVTGALLVEYLKPSTTDYQGRVKMKKHCVIATATFARNLLMCPRLSSETVIVRQKEPTLMLEKGVAAEVLKESHPTYR